MKNFQQILLIAVISFIVALGVHKMDTPAKIEGTQKIEAAKTETVYARVMRTKTLRCGYMNWPPFIEKDLKTGEMSGFFFDYLAAIGNSIGIKIEWTEEIGLSDATAALNTGRIDAYCVALGAIPARAVNMYVSKPMMFYPFYAYARADDTRFDNKLESLNDPNVTLSTMEGEYTSIYARSTFPKAKVFEVTSLQGSSALFLNVETKKADIVFQDPASFRSYDEKNKGKLKVLPGGFGGTVPGGFLFKYGEEEMKRIFDYAIDDLQSRLVSERLYRQYGFDKTFDILPPAQAVEGAPTLQK